MSLAEKNMNAGKVAERIYAEFKQNIASFGYKQQAVFTFGENGHSYVFVLGKSEVGKWHIFIINNDSRLDWNWYDEDCSETQAKKYFKELTNKLKECGDMKRSFSYRKEVVA